MEHLSRWPLLLAAAALVGAAVALDLTDTSARGLAASLITLAACCLGGMIYAEGSRHREWTRAERERERRHDDDGGRGTR